MGNLSNQLLILFSLSLVFVLAGVVIHDINPNNTNIMYDCNNTIMSRYGQCTNNNLNGAVPNTDAQRVTANLPSIDTTNNNLLTLVVQTISNVFSSIGNWLSGALGFYYLQYALDVPRLALQSIGLPPFFVCGIVGLITALTVIFFIDWMKGAFA